ncbi:MAG: carbohydrate ABC transporter permease [Chloroflexi bacterium]|nr:carbohydrate ABC transporter permease [Chloroflexota bacterium]
MIEAAERTAPRHPSRPTKLTAGGVAIQAVIVVAAVLAVVPFLFMVMTALKSYASVINNVIWPWPPLGGEAPQFGNFAEAIQTIGWDSQWQTFLFFRYLANSVIVSLSIVTGVLVTSTMAAYALGRMELPGKQLLFVIVLITMMLPEDLTLVPKIVMMFNLRWYNTYFALIVPFLVNVFSIFLLRQFFMQIPKDLFEAALIDGMGHVRFMISIVVPLSKPALLTVALLNFIWAWDAFKWPLLATRDSNMRVLAVGLQQFMQGQGTQVHLLMAFAAMVILPVLILYFVAQRQFREGILNTGLKG